MPAESWVTIGGFFASTASAIAAFFAVKQTILQRTISTKPQIIINSQNVETILSSSGIFELDIENSDHHFNIPVPITNVGLGTALNIKYKWTFDYKNNVEKCGFKEIKEDPMISTLKKISHSGGKHYHYTNEKDSIYKYFKFMRNGKFSMYGVDNEMSELEYLMPVNQEKSPSAIKFPSLILMLLSGIETTPDTPLKTFAGVMNAGQLLIRYEDISGNKLAIRFNCTVQMIRFVSATENGPRSTFRIEFHRVHSRSVPGLEKIRKSYADFISEHNINRNR